MEISLYSLYWVIQGKGQSFFIFVYVFFKKSKFCDICFCD